jgi:hypothetical protein
LQSIVRHQKYSLIVELPLQRTPEIIQVKIEQWSIGTESN